MIEHLKKVEGKVHDVFLNGANKDFKIAPQKNNVRLWSN